MRRKKDRLLLLTPPFVQTNCPYPATMHLTGFLRGLDLSVEQRDLSVKVALDVLRASGDETTDELIEVLQNPHLPAEAKRNAGAAIDELAIWIRENVDESFGFSRYAERICANAVDFSDVERQVRRRGVMDGALECRLEEAIAETHPTMIGVTCPFPGTLVGSFKIARHVKRHHPEIRLVLGGGFVNTELRHMTDDRPRKYFDEIVFDEGYAPMAALMGCKVTDVPPFVCPDYEDIDFSEYFDVVETDNPMHRLWSSGKWVRLQMARGCYWHKCAFCDVRLPYIGCFEQPKAAEIVDAMQKLGTQFHFVDEAMPPALIRGVCQEILRRKFTCAWWGNIRFDTSFTPELARLMAKAGCVAVTGGLECANDRLLKLMNKGITLASARRVIQAFRRAGIMVHAYLMYAFPTETEEEALGALEFVRGLFKADLIQSAFWHRFALTIHSPIAAAPDKYGIRLLPRPRRKRIFCLNEIPYEEPKAPDWTLIGKALSLALYNYLEGRGLEKSVYYWRHAVRR